MGIRDSRWSSSFADDLFGLHIVISGEILMEHFQLWNNVIHCVILFIALICLIPLLGNYIYYVLEGKPSFIHSLLKWLENLFYRLCCINPHDEMSWVRYMKTLIVFNLIGLVFLFCLQMLQNFLPLNVENFSAPSWHSALNTSISFVTNTNWQSYAGETTLSYFTQMFGLTVQNFLSAGTGMAVLLALIRGIKRKTSETIGNFWADLIRTIVYILLPLSIIMAFLLIGEGVVQSFSPYVEITTLENGKQKIPLGPVASQVAIKQLGTNGGGFFNANSAHPFENPTNFTNLLETLAIFLIPAATVYAYGMMIGSKKHALMLLVVMFILFVSGLAITFYSDYVKNPVLGSYPVLEGIETRFGIHYSTLWTVMTTDTSNGSVNAMISSLSALAGGTAMFNIMLGELIFGGVGVGLCSMIMFSILTIFLSGLMVGRTPEYLGKKIEKKEMQWVMVAVLVPGALILIGSGISAILPEALSSLGNRGPHGLSEILYAFSSAAGNNGSAFAGINANTIFFNLVLGIVMILGRLSIVIPSLAIAGLLARKKITPISVGTFSTDTILFIVLLICVILIVGALTFFPAIFRCEVNIVCGEWSSMEGFQLLFPIKISL